MKYYADNYFANVPVDALHEQLDNLLTAAGALRTRLGSGEPFESADAYHGAVEQRRQCEELIDVARRELARRIHPEPAPDALTALRTARENLVAVRALNPGQGRWDAMIARLDALIAEHSGAGNV